MARQLNITGKNSNEVYHILYPSNLIGFCRYDFTLFMEHCIDLCRLSMRTGEYSVEDIVAVRNSISSCHKYFEKNMRSTFEKIVVDCWIEYLCRQNEVGIVTLWTNFMGCRNDFEKAVFARLSEYRHNHAINQWVNLLKLQEYAQKKVEFIFGIKLSGASEANARAAYFDLMYNVALNEAGISVDELGGTEVYTMGRTPNSPFVMNSASREIARNVLGNMFYTENASIRSSKNPELSDQTAMDAFSVFKNYIPKNDDSLVNTIVKSLTGTPQKIYLPTSFKAVIDLEIDAIIESGAVIQRCERCNEYFLKDADYNYNYCSRAGRDGMTCLEIANKAEEEENAAQENRITSGERPKIQHNPLSPNEIAVFSLRLDKLYKEVAQRVNVDMTQRDFSEWYRRLLGIKRRISTGELTESELAEFEEYSRTHKYESRPEPAKPAQEAGPKSPRTDSEGGVKPFVFERVDRSKAIEQGVLSRNDPALSQQAQQRPPAPPIQPQKTPPQNIQQAPRSAPPVFGQQQRQPYSPARVIRGGGNGNVKFNYFDRPLEPSAKPVQQPVQQSMPAEENVFTPFGREAEPRQTTVSNTVSTPKPEPVQMPQTPPQKPARSLELKPFIDENDRIPNPLMAVDDEIFDTEKIEAEIESLGKNLKYGGVGLDDIEDDIKIYNLAQPEPAPKKPIENVKIFEPAKKKKNRLTDGISRRPVERLIRPTERDEREEEVKRYEEPDFSESMGFENIQPEPVAQANDNPLKAKAVSAYRTLVNPRNDDGGAAPEDIFSDVLKGINRSDGFEENIETDDNGVPLSHKTKHVMDAIFKPSKASPFLSINLDDENE